MRLARRLSNYGTGVMNGKRLDELGRCCGRKPLFYKRPTDTYVPGPHHFCTRCDAAFSADGQQIDNWAYVNTAAGFVRRQS
jgi:hypothetical protein